MKLLVILSLLLSLTSNACTHAQHRKTPTDQQLMNNTVLLVSESGSCSGVQIRIGSKKHTKRFVLTAGHCLPLAVDGKIKAITEHNKTYELFVLIEDQNSDLLVLSPVPGLKGVEIAKKAYRHEKIKTLTHGLGLPTYRTDGTLIGYRLAKYLAFEINSKEDEDHCNSMHKFMTVPTMFGLVCVTSVVETTSTAMVVHGSSGGPVFDMQGRLVGIVSGNMESISFFVSLVDIQKLFHTN